MWTPVSVLWLSCVVGPADEAGSDGTEEEGYYARVEIASHQPLREALHELIDDHRRLSYPATWLVIEDADQHPHSDAHVLDIYRNVAYEKGDHSHFHREHTWPKSYGFPRDGGDNYPFTDCHALFAADATYNLSRGNRPYGNCERDCRDRPAEGTGTSNKIFPGGWEVWPGRRGDVARALFYLDVRYEGGRHRLTGAEEPDLVLTDDLTLVAESATGDNLPRAYMGSLSDLIEWHEEDPVSAEERRRNTRVFQAQGNRNPFVDHPEWVACLYRGEC
jgi:endonuclease I